jgi:hypothetical protein
MHKTLSIIQAGGRPRVARSLWVMLLLMCLHGCSWPVSNDDTVSAHATNQGIVLKNNTNDRIYFILFGRRAETLINWIPTLTSRQSLGEGEIHLFPFTEIILHRDGEEAVLVFWWTAEEEQGQRRPGKVQRITVML